MHKSCVLTAYLLSLMSIAAVFPSSNTSAMAQPINEPPNTSWKTVLDRMNKRQEPRDRGSGGQGVARIQCGAGAPVPGTGSIAASSSSGNGGSLYLNANALQSNAFALQVRSSVSVNAATSSSGNGGVISLSPSELSGLNGGIDLSSVTGAGVIAMDKTIRTQHPSELTPSLLVKN